MANFYARVNRVQLENSLSYCVNACILRRSERVLTWGLVTLTAAHYTLCLSNVHNSNPVIGNFYSLSCFRFRIVTSNCTYIHLIVVTKYIYPLNNIDHFEHFTYNFRPQSSSRSAVCVCVSSIFRCGPCFTFLKCGSKRFLMLLKRPGPIGLIRRHVKQIHKFSSPKKLFN